MTAFADLLGCRVPVQQAPMGAVSGLRLATAVARAGALGTVSATGTTPDRLADRLDAVPVQVRRGLAVNLAGAPFDLQLVAAAAERVAVVDLFWSDPDPAVVSVVHDGGALACWQVGSVEEAVAAAEAGCDVVAVQGTEAGGHVRGRASLRPLLDQVLGCVTVPVLAAGGLVDAADVASVLAAGAAGARMGTRFLATDESAAAPGYEQAVVEAGPDATVVTGAFADCPLCRASPRARVLRSAVAALEAGGGAPGSGRPPTEDQDGPVAGTAMYAGAGVSRVTRVVPVHELVASLVPAVARA